MMEKKSAYLNSIDKNAERTVTAIIPARAGSKGIHNKNIIDFCGKPLIAWSIEQAMQSKYIENVYVTTDGEEIAEISRKYGAKIIWRPADLASDTASSESALIHAISVIEERRVINTVMFLQATSPIRLIEDLDNAVDIFFNNLSDSLFSMCVLEDYCIWKNTENKLQSLTYNYLNRGRRQERESFFLENGSIYIFKPEILRKYKNRLGGKIGMYKMPFDRSYEIDSMEDVELCSYFMKKYYK